MLLELFSQIAIRNKVFNFVILVSVNYVLLSLYRLMAILSQNQVDLFVLSRCRIHLFGRTHELAGELLIFLNLESGLVLMTQERLYWFIACIDVFTLPFGLTNLNFEVVFILRM
jgi:hypothetical protein